MNRAGVATALLLVAAGCTLAPATGDTPSPTASDDLPPPGYGTLRQEEISLSLRTQDLEIMVTPLSESFIRVTAPDTYERLAGISTRHRTSGGEDEVLFLVSFFTRQSEVRFVPEEVQLLSRGLRLRPNSITPVTPTWGQRRVRQRTTEMAVYAFPQAVDLEADLSLAYGLTESGDWQAIRSRVQAERARARARAGVGVGAPSAGVAAPPGAGRAEAGNTSQAGKGRAQTSSSYFEIFR